METVGKSPEKSALLQDEAYIYTLGASGLREKVTCGFLIGPACRRRENRWREAETYGKKKPLRGHLWCGSDCIWNLTFPPLWFMGIRDVDFQSGCFLLIRGVVKGPRAGGLVVRGEQSVGYYIV